MTELLPYFLLAFIVFQQFFFLWHIQRLVNKVMSRDYRDYVSIQHPPAPRPKVIAEDLPQEDLGALHGFGV